VLPCNAAGPEFGSFMDAAAMQEVLLEIQALMFRRASATPPETLGRTALAAFSSGNGFLGTFLSLPKNRAHAFVTDVLREVYLFDPPHYLADTTAASVLAWAGASDSGRHVRLYSQGLERGHDKVLGAASPAVPFIETTADGTRTAGVIPVATWTRTIESRLGRKVRFPLDWRDAHQLIPSMLLTHALAISDF
jgi:hypothetical protein